MTQHQYHPSTMTGRVVATPRLSKERSDRPTRTTLFVAGRHSGRRVRVFAVDELASAVCASLRSGDLVTISGVMAERSWGDSVFRVLELDSFTIHPRDAA
ncbi:MAG TPA: hypothetical protein VNV83_05150 [Acidimicrobiales bacterium]|jgi:hypothetical protein|nr:hypothetical protein [Acidimicrobiales bacterium]